MGKTRKIFAYIIITYFLLLLGGATKFISNFDPRAGAAGVILYSVIFLLLASLAKKPLLDFKSIVFFSALALWTALHFVFDQELKYLPFVWFWMYLLGAYLLVRSFGYSILGYFVRIVCVLSIISIFFWSIQLLFGTEELVSIAPFPGRHTTSGTFLFYNAFKEVEQEDFVASIPRNSGFAWEPGRFASILILAIAIQIITNHGRFSLKNRINLILTTTLITTFSTTGYVSFFILFTINLLAGKRMKKWVKIAFLVCTLLVFGYVSTLPFMTRKILARANSELFVTDGSSMQKSITNDSYVTVDRFEGLFLDGVNFIHDPIIGYGLAQQNTYISRNVSDLLVTSNGITKTFAKWGCVFGLSFFVLLFIASSRLARCFKYNVKWFLFVTILMISISYDFFEDPIVLSLTLYPVFRYDKSYKNIFIRRRKVS